MKNQKKYQEIIDELNTDQLVELVELIAAEAIKRDIKEEIATAIEDEEEMTEIYRSAYEEEALKVKEQKKINLALEARQQAQKDGGIEVEEKISEAEITWRQKKAIASALECVGVDPSETWDLQVWSRKDKRIFFQRGRNHVFATYHHDGTDSVAPKRLVIRENIDAILLEGTTRNADFTSDLKALFGAICNKWNTFDVDSDDLKDFDGISDKKDLDKYLAAIDINRANR